MEIFESVEPGVHCYSPFAKSSNGLKEMSLKELSKNVILKHITIRRLAICEKQLPIPKRIWEYISDLSIEDFEIIESAPLTDVFTFNYFYRALTYTVYCLRDEQKYLITFGYNPVGDVQKKVDHEQWVKVQHKNIMSVCAIVEDYKTKNVFYVYDQPCASLENMWKMFQVKKLPIPSAFLHNLITDMSDAFRFIISNGLQYSRFGMGNIFVMNDRMVLENGFMLKSMEFIHDRKKGYRSDERNMVCDIASILKLLLQSDDNQQLLQNLIDEVESKKCIEDLLQKLNLTQKSEDSFSLGELIESLKINFE